jgi:hydrogenase-4 component B
LITLVAMGLISGLAAACFAKAFGIVFLGSARSHEAAEAHEAAWPMCAAMAIPAVLCVAIGLAAPLVVSSLASVVAGASGLSEGQVRASLGVVTASLGIVVAVFAVLVVVAGLAWVLRAHRLARAGTRRAPVWGCGFLRGTPRMQYTASSFAQPLTTQFRLFVRNRETLVPPSGYFPVRSSYASDSGDPFLRLLFVPSFRWFSQAVSRMNVVQQGHTHVYVLYVAATLIVLLIWGSF